MKKNLLVIITIFLIIIIIIFSSYYNYRKILVQAKQENKEFEQFSENAILGSSLMTLINKAIDKNEKNEVIKDSENRYIENETNSIHIEIKFLESDKIYDMEAIGAIGSEQFIKNYNNMNFICTKKEYHEKTRKIKYLLFEQI